MLDSLFWATLLVAALTLLGPDPQKVEGRFNWVNKFAYAVFVTTGALSPLWGGHIAVASGFDFSFETAIGFAWIGIALALPLSLLTARIFGAEHYESYWSYLLAFRQDTRRGIVLWMVAATSAALAVGLLLMVASHSDAFRLSR